MIKCCVVFCYKYQLIDVLSYLFLVMFKVSIDYIYELVLRISECFLFLFFINRKGKKQRLETNQRQAPHELLGTSRQMKFLPLDILLMSLTTASTSQGGSRSDD